MWALKPTGQSVFGVMVLEDSQSEVFVVAVAGSSVLEQLDVVVGAFQRAGRDRVVVQGK